jgi:hypothetical protein
MRDIENAAKPVLKPLILGDNIRLTPPDHLQIATWAVLKAMVAEYDEQSAVTTHYKQRQYMFNHHRPPLKNWAVWIGHFERDKWIPEWVSRPFRVLFDKVAIKRASRETAHFNSNSSTQIVGKLLIHVVHVPHPQFIERWRLSTPSGAPLFRIWPPITTSFPWPHEALTDRDADHVCDVLARWVKDVGSKSKAANSARA